MKHILAAAAAALLIAVPVTGFAADTPPATPPQHEAQGPDFSACDAMEGREHGQCVAEIAMAYGDDHAQGAGADDAKDAHESAAQDEHDPSPVAEAAQAMGEKCDAKEGREHGECISALAHTLGELAARQGQGGAPHGDTTTSTATVHGQSGR